MQLNRVLTAAIAADAICWGSLIFLGFKWITCTCGA
jgi:hypothetical protein